MPGALSKAELQERLWPSTFVGETNQATHCRRWREGSCGGPKDGDEIRIGPVALTFRVVTPTRVTETMKSA